MKQLFIIFTIFFGWNFVLQAQQQQMYTQFMFNKMGLNPAYAGNEDYLSATLVYRDQWSGFPGAPTAQNLSLNLPRLGNKVGIGFNFERQSIGISQKLTYEMMYAYKFVMGKGTMSFGMNISGRNYIQDFTDSRLFAIQDINLDPSIPRTVQTNNLFNAGFGVYYNTNMFYFGASLPRMVRSDLDFDNNNFFSTEVRHLFVMTGGTFILSQDLRFTPQMMFRYSEKSPYSVDLNLSATWKEKFFIGATYRTGGGVQDFGESIDAIAAMQVSDRLLLGFAYDINMSRLRNLTNGSLEVLMTYNFKRRKAETIVVNPRYF